MEAKLRVYNYGKFQDMHQIPLHYIKTSIDDFILSEYPDKILSSLIHFSLGLELYIKQKLELINKNIIYTDTNRDFLNMYKKMNNKNEKIDYILNYKTNNKTIPFTRSIEFFLLFYNIPNDIIDYLNTLKDIRNDLFHTGTKFDVFEMNKLFINTILWLYDFNVQFTERDDWLLSATQLGDPFGEKFKTFKTLKEHFNNPTDFYIQKQVFQCTEEYQQYYYIDSRIKGRVIREADKFLLNPCPACHHQKLGKTKDLIICHICHFAVTKKEFEKSTFFAGYNFEQL